MVTKYFPVLVFDTVQFFIAPFNASMADDFHPANLGQSRWYYLQT